MTKLSISEFDSNMQCFRIQLDRIQLDIFWTSFKDQIIPSVKPDQQFERDREKIRYDAMITGPIVNTKALSVHFRYYKTMANNYTLGKK